MIVPAPWSHGPVTIQPAESDARHDRNQRPRKGPLFIHPCQSSIMLDMEQELSRIQIERKPPEGEVFDVMGGSARWEVKVHDHGLVALIDVMPRFAPVG